MHVRVVLFKPFLAFLGRSPELAILLGPGISQAVPEVESESPVGKGASKRAYLRRQGTD